MEGLHIGKMIQAELKAQGRSVTWFAKHIHCDRTNAYKIFNNSHIDSELLFRISQVLGHNFMLDCANYFEKMSQPAPFSESPTMQSVADTSTDL